MIPDLPCCCNGGFSALLCASVKMSKATYSHNLGVFFFSLIFILFLFLVVVVVGLGVWGGGQDTVAAV